MPVGFKLTQLAVPIEVEDSVTAPLPTPDDVRMRGFRQRVPVAQACRWIDSQTVPLPSEPVPLTSACGRVLAGHVTAGRNVPAFDRSAMDGFAVRAEETIAASDYSPVNLQIIGEALPGRPWGGNMMPGQAVRIMTGAPLPPGADAVVPAEQARTRGVDVAICAAVPTGKNIGRTGEDVRVGTVVLSAGRRLRPQDVGILASLGLADVDVHRAPRVRVLITGNELATPGKHIGPYEIYEANSYLLGALLARDGANLEAVERLPDDPAAIGAALQAPGADVLLVSGGSSVGREDHAPRLLAEFGELAIHGVAMRPSSPAGMGRIGPTLVFLLPGNPVSCLCAYDYFAGRAVRRLSGRSSNWPYRRIELPLVRKLVSEIGRTDYCRVQVTSAGIEPLSISGASMLSSTTRADGFVVVAEECEGFAPGEPVTVWLYDSP
jgi:molybdopterin molybdotransferase